MVFGIASFATIFVFLIKEDEAYHELIHGDHKFA